MILALALGLLALSAAQPPANVEPDYEEIVVTGSRLNRKSLGRPIDHYRRHCFDPNRLAARSAPPPASDPYWRPLGEEVRAQIGITDPATLAFGLTDAVLDHRLILKIDRRPGKPGLVESLCQLIVVGGRSHAALQKDMAALFRGPGTARHVGHSAGSEPVPGWRQHVWTAMPGRRSVRWQDVAAHSRQAGGTFLVVTDPRFYSEHSYVLGDLKTRIGGGPPVTILSLAYTYRDRSPSSR